MLTKNFYNYMVMKMNKRTLSNALVSLNGTTYDAYYTASNTSDNVLTNLYLLGTAVDSGGVIIGTGATPATADDYKLDSPISSGISYVNPTSTAVSTDNDGISIFASYAVTNTGTTALTISEIGLFGRLYYAGSTSNLCPALLERTVLESPITIVPGETKTLTYTIRFNYPTA